MATCNYSAYVGGSCGSSTVNATVLQCVPLENCQNDVRVHLRALEFEMLFYRLKHSYFLLGQVSRYAKVWEL